MIAFVSSNDQWGGSEELWSLAALALARRGHRLAVFKSRLDRAHPRIRALLALGCTVADLRGPRLMPGKLLSLAGLFWPVARRMIQVRLWFALRAPRPELVVISQGLNYDGWLAARACRRLNLPYVMLSQKADDLYWPTDSMRAELRELYRGARAALFVSEHNLQLTEEQIGCRLPNARVVRNPFEVAWELRDDWPDETDGLNLACLARLDAREKGQDLLLRVMAMPKWRSRPIRVSFFGAGHNANGLKEMAALLGLENVRFAGFTATPDAVWDDHHGLILPSRCEGLPLSQVEAMLSGRVAIVTDVGGTAEVLIDGETGFLAAAPTVAEIDVALERAWSRRGEWRAIGRAAAVHVRTLTTPDPAGDFADRLLDLACAGPA